MKNKTRSGQDKNQTCKESILKIQTADEWRPLFLQYDIEYCR